jgi:hypothetical protein
VAAILAVTLPACGRDAAVRDTPSGPSFEFGPSAVYVLAVDMFADAYYTATSTWTIDKTASPSSHDRYAGESFTSDYVVTLEETVTESEFYVIAQLTLTNYNDYDVEFDIGDGGSVSCSAYTVPMNGGVVYCQDSVSLSDKIDGSVTVKITGLDSQGELFEIKPEAFYTFYEPSNVVGSPVTVSDSYYGELGEASDSRTFEYTRTFTCSRSASDYTDGVDDDEYSNTATITGTDEMAQALVSVTCSAGFMDLLKLTDGAVDAEKEWSFRLYDGPDGYGTKPFGSSTTLGVKDGVLTFDGPALDPTRAYTVCELNVPAGYASLWQIDGTIINPYNPDADAGQDLGNRCADFGAKTTMPLTVGTTIRFQVDNTHPGGDPRSAGYWKNWNACTVGGQAATAALNGGYKEGFWLLEDVLDPSIGGGIEWPDLTIKSCEQAVAILDQRVLAKDGRGKKLANDAARTLAMQLLAAQLNLGAGACTTPDVQDAVLAAEELLDKIDFDGSKKTAYLTAKSGAPYREALRLAAILNTYNNGGYCGSTQ